MSTRFKLLVVFLALSLIPMLIMRANGERAMHAMGQELADRSRDALIDTAQYELKRLVEDHARVLKRERQLLENALSSQVDEVMSLLSGEPCAEARTPEANCAEGDPKRICRVDEKGACQSLSCNPSEQVLGCAEGNVPGSDSIALSSLLPWYRKMAKRHPDLILWQETVLADGRFSLYPAVHVPEGYDPRRSPWFTHGTLKQEPAWTRAYTDPISGSLVMAVSAPIIGPDQRFAGMAAIVAPVEAFLHENEHIRKMSENVSSYLVRVDPSYPEKLLVVAREGEPARGHRHMRGMRSRTLLPVSDGDAPLRMAEDIAANRPGVRRMLYQGRESLLAYGPTDNQGTALLLVVPEKDVTAEASAMESFVLARVSRLISVSGLFLTIVALSVALAALVLSSSLTRNIRKVAAAAARIAGGDLSTRVDIRAKDETGELARAFNDMIPGLTAHVRIQEALDVADQVQRNLLPDAAPPLAGWDIAGRTVFCEKTGGDWFDFIPMERDGKNLLGVAVGDVSDHGIPSALLMTSARGFLRARAGMPGDAAAITRDVNRLLCEDVKDSGRFMTLFFLLLEEEGSSLRFVRAGHEPGLIVNPDSSGTRELRDGGIALGVSKDSSFSVYEDELLPGEILALVTDGIREARSPSGEDFGTDRLAGSLARNAQLGAEEMVAAVLRDLAEFTGHAPQEDDVTMVIVKKPQRT